MYNDQYHGPTLQLLNDGERNKYYLYLYRTRRSQQEDANSKLIWRFKDNERNAVTAVQKNMGDAIEYAKVHFLRLTHRWYCIALPRSSCNPNLSCESICAYLDNRFAWISHIPNALVRVTEVPSSSQAYREGRARTSRETHHQTIEYFGPELDPRAGIILVDDILTQGNTFNACCDILRAETPCEQIFGLFVGKTLPPPHINY